MKTIIALVFSLFFLGAKAQNLHLEQAGKKLKTGFIITILGGGIAASSSFIENRDTKKQVTILGLTAIGVGAILTFDGYNSIEKAGRLTVAPSGVTYRF